MFSHFYKSKIIDYSSVIDKYITYYNKKFNKEYTFFNIRIPSIKRKFSWRIYNFHVTNWKNIREEKYTRKKKIINSKRNASNVKYERFNIFVIFLNVDSYLLLYNNLRRVHFFVVALFGAPIRLHDTTLSFSTGLFLLLLSNFSLLSFFFLSNFFISFFFFYLFIFSFVCSPG